MLDMVDLFVINLQERLEVIERDQREYTLDDEDQKVQSVILTHEPSRNETMMLKKTLSCSYPNLCFNEALKKENEKLQLELQRSQANLDMSQCEVIQRLLEVTETVASNSLLDDGSPVKESKRKEKNTSDADSDREHSAGETYPKKSSASKTSRSVFFEVKLLYVLPSPLLPSVIGSFPLFHGLLSG